MVGSGLRAAILASAALAMAGAGAAQADCVSDWSLAAPLVRTEGLVTVEQLTAMAGSEIDGDIVKATLCKEKGSYVYRLVVRSRDGRLKSMTVDAREPFKR